MKFLFINLLASLGLKFLMTSLEKRYYLVHPIGYAEQITFAFPEVVGSLFLNDLHTNLIRYFLQTKETKLNEK